MRTIISHLLWRGVDRCPLRNGCRLPCHVPCKTPVNKDRTRALCVKTKWRVGSVYVYIYIYIVRISISISISISIYRVNAQAALSRALQDPSQQGPRSCTLRKDKMKGWISICIYIYILYVYLYLYLYLYIELTRRLPCHVPRKTPVNKDRARALCERWIGGINKYMPKGYKTKGYISICRRVTYVFVYTTKGYM